MMEIKLYAIVSNEAVAASKGKFYVYLLLDPTKFYLPFYIGKGCGSRWKSHLREKLEKTTNPRKFHRIQLIRKSGFEPNVMFWQTDMEEQAAYQLEESLIKRFGRKRYEANGILENLMEVARPPGLTHCQNREEVIAKISGRTGEKNYFFGKTHTDEVKAQISERHSGKEITEDHRKKISEAMTGRFMSEEHRRKIGEFHKGKKKNQDSIRLGVETKRSNGTLGMSPEAAKKMVDTKRRNGTLTRTPESVQKAKDTIKSKGGLKRTPEHIAKIVATRRLRGSYGPKSNEDVCDSKQ